MISKLIFANKHITCSLARVSKHIHIFLNFSFYNIIFFNQQTKIQVTQKSTKVFMDVRHKAI